MIIEICPYCNEKNFYVGKRISNCAKCGKVYKFDECEQIIINKEPFTECPMCGTKYDHPVTECTAKNKKLEPICGFGYQFIDDAEEIAKMNEEKERKQQELSSQQLQQPLQPQPQNIPRCPICQSSDLSKISTVKKATKIGLFGIFGAGDMGKTWKCNNCGSKF